MRLTLFISVYLLDLLTKMAVRHFLALGEEIKILPFFSLTHVENTGVAFGLFQNKNLYLIGIGSIVMGALAYLSYQLRHRDRFGSFVIVGVLAGALGNFTDRLIYGRVTDFLDFHIASYYWPVFNVADSAICVGAGLLLWNNFRQGKNH